MIIITKIMFFFSYVLERVTLNPITKVGDFSDNPLSSNVLFVFGVDFRIRSIFSAFYPAL